MKRSEIEYIINKEKRTVVAIMKGCRHDAYEDIIKTLHNNNITTFATQSFWELEYFISDTYRGKAHCSEEDTWDEEIGKRIARSRMLKKYYKAKIRVFDRVKNNLTKSLEGILNSENYAVKRFDYADSNDM